MTEQATVGRRAGALRGSGAGRVPVPRRIPVDGHRTGTTPRRIPVGGHRTGTASHGGVRTRSTVCDTGDGPVRPSAGPPASGARRGPVGTDRGCPGRVRVRRLRGHGAVDRILVGTAVMLGAAVVVVLLGLVADLAAASHAAPVEPVGVSVER